MLAENILLSRNIESIPQHTWFIGYPEPTPLTQNPAHRFSSLQYYQTNLGDERFQFSLTPPTQKQDLVILYFPKSKQEANLLLELAGAAVSSEGRIWLVGENKSGIKSAASLLKKLGWEYRKVDSARHCTLIEAHPNEFIESNIDTWWNVWKFQDQSFWSLPGVFSHGKLDKGTDLLIKHLPEAKGTSLDFGCGSGILGLTQMAKGGAQTILCDTSLMALTSVEKTINQQHQDLKDRIKLIPTATPADLNKFKKKVNQIISNPPFHAGTKTSYAATEEFLRESVNWATSDGTLTIVANDFLKYEPLIKKAWGNCKELARERGFKILTAYK